MKNSKTAVACLSCLVAGSALFFIAVRPCEPRAEAAEALQVADSVSDLQILSKNLNASAVKEMGPSVQYVASIAKTPAMGRVCGWYDLLQGTVGSRVWTCL